MKQTGKRSAGKPHAAFDVAGAGNVAMIVGLRSIAKAREVPPTPTVRAPASDPTGRRTVASTGATRCATSDPTPHTARPVSHEIPVDPHAITAGASRVASGPHLLACHRLYPGRTEEADSLVLPSNSGLPTTDDGSAPALNISGPPQRSLVLWPACSPSRLCDPLHRRLRRLRLLYRRFDCYRAERSSSRVGLTPTVDQRLSRRPSDQFYWGLNNIVIFLVFLVIVSSWVIRREYGGISISWSGGD